MRFNEELTLSLTDAQQLVSALVSECDADSPAGEVGRLVQQELIIIARESFGQPEDFDFDSLENEIVRDEYAVFSEKEIALLFEDGCVDYINAQG
tara:strand:+ start:169 stop:453 length:285 start_codon:yes stop_codon:yes gene_type:complete